MSSHNPSTRSLSGKCLMTLDVSPMTRKSLHMKRMHKTGAPKMKTSGRICSLKVIKAVILGKTHCLFYFLTLSLQFSIVLIFHYLCWRSEEVTTLFFLRCSGLLKRSLSPKAHPKLHIWIRTHGNVGPLIEVLLSLTLGSAVPAGREPAFYSYPSSYSTWVPYSDLSFPT